jgi:biopolymer transport protein ExbD/TolR/metallopeptidase family M12-like protein
MCMKLVVVVGAFVMVCGCLSPVIRFGGGKSAHEVQQEEYGRVTPTSFAGHREWAGEVSTARIRVWADDAYRAQNLHWQQTIDDQLEAANEVLAATFGVRLVADYRVWQRHAPGASLEESLGALAELDGGDDVLSVVGLTSSISLVSATFEQLGFASVGGRHMLIRGYADVEERKVFEAAFTELSAEERDLLYKSRRRHKTTAVLLHELGHNLGAEHVPTDDTLMHDSYSERSSAFDPQSHEVILATLDQRLHRGRSAPAAEPTTPPSTAHAATPAAHHKLTVTIDAAGTYSAGNHTLDGAALDGLLRQSFTDDPDTEIIVTAAKHAPRTAVIDLLDRAKAIGLQRFSLASP